MNATDRLNKQRFRLQLQLPRSFFRRLNTMISEEIDQTHASLQLTKPFANTIVRTQSERHIRVRQNILSIFWRKSIRLKTVWFGKILKKESMIKKKNCSWNILLIYLWIAMNSVNRNKNGHSARNHKIRIRIQGIAFFIGRYRTFSIQKRQRRVHAQNF